MASTPTNDSGSRSTLTIRDLQEKYDTARRNSTEKPSSCLPTVTVPVRLKAVHRDSEVSVFQLGGPHTPTMERSESSRSDESEESLQPEVDEQILRERRKSENEQTAFEGGVLGDEKLLGARWFRMRRRLGSF
ncbi:hypothetical protein BJ508DRAFT_411129 [Ascobolus immersus RN42]|uniref:Uncharacterized protein n=1 Tax=Ascobolus immersus RN42 TaxID=1160509 RepID=A0A3N4IJT7_ASCIM|nr:hypothetical protein BJ508DRAFT_411129 [Ascobolus immersus RN42]